MLHFYLTDVSQARCHCVGFFGAVFASTVINDECFEFQASETIFLKFSTQIREGHGINSSTHCDGCSNISRKQHTSIRYALTIPILSVFDKVVLRATPLLGRHIEYNAFENSSRVTGRTCLVHDNIDKRSLPSPTVLYLM